jgi:dipeptidyl aminopeptidase/acylaminoacyl peptidase
MHTEQKEVRLRGLLRIGCAWLAGLAFAQALATPVVNDIPGADPMVPFDRYLQPSSYEGPQLSPDGRQIAVLAPVDGVTNLMIADAAEPTALRPLTRDAGRGMQSVTIWYEPTFRWAENGRHIFYIRDDEGDENWVLYSIDTRTGERRQLTPASGVRVRGLQTSPKFPDEVLFGMNDRTATQVDYYRANAVTGAVTHAGTAAPYLLKLFDGDFRERVAIALLPDLSIQTLTTDADGQWKEINRTARADTPSMSANMINDLGGAVFSADGRRLLAFSSQGLDTTALVEYELSSGTRRVVAVERGVDIKRAIVHPATHAPQAYIRHFTHREWVVLDPAVAPDFAHLQSLGLGELRIDSRSRDDRRWLVSFMRADSPVRYFLYDRGTRSTVPLGVSSPQLAELALSDMQPVVTKSSDGFDLVSYIAYPSWIELDERGVPPAPLPVLTVVHGGPSDERAETGFAPVLQWLTNRGYAVFVVNFRGSPGFGKAFMNAQRHEWGGAMNRDVIEQVQALVARRIADPKRLGVLGGSYGGYETLVAMTMTPDVFACGVAVVGPSNLETFMDPSTIPPDWELDALHDLLGDPATAEGRKLLRERSPIHYAQQTRGRMLVVQGANDVRVPVRESDQVVGAMDEAGVKVTYLLYPDEGHGILRNENNRSFLAITEVFLGECLGGRYSALGDRIEGSSVQVPLGARHIPGLSDALAARKDDGLLQVDPSLDRSRFGELTGRYDLQGHALDVALEDGVLFVSIPGQGKHELLPFEEDGFFMREGPVRLRFQRAGDGAIAAVAIETGGPPQTAKRIETGSAAGTETFGSPQ